jgi:hypothetical protein
MGTSPLLFTYTRAFMSMSITMNINTRSAIEVKNPCVLVMTEDEDSLTVTVANALNLSRRIASMILTMCDVGRERGRFRKEDRSRLYFLKDTLDLTHGVLSAQNEQGVRVPSIFQVFVRGIYLRMKDVFFMISKIERGDAGITQNFDIFELKLRSHLDELRALFPEKALAYPADAIGDRDARLVWIQYVGQRFYVRWDEFIAFLRDSHVLEETSPGYDSLILSIRYFVDFPADDRVSSYRWGLLVRLFGPLSAFSQNLSEMVGRRGFLGSINRIQAYEILTLSHSPNCLLVRFSRTAPRFLAITYMNSKGEIAHRLNQDPDTDLPAPIGRFIRQHFPNHTMVSQSLDIKKVLDNNSQLPLSEYAQEWSGYLK